MTTQDVICNFLAVLKDTGHKPEDVKAALLLFSGAAIAQPAHPIGCVAKDGYTILYFQAERLPFETELYIKQGDAL